MRYANVLAGYTPDRGGRDALALGALLAGHDSRTLTVAAIRPPGWTTPGSARVDAEWTRYLRERAEEALEEAAGLVSGDGPGEPERIIGVDRGSGHGLAAVARRSGAEVIVIGSPPRAARGRIAVGSTADQLLHSSPVPVALATAGYGERPPPAIDRLTVAYRRSPGCDAAVRLAAAGAARLGVPLRLLTLVVPRPAVRGARRAALEEDMLRRSREQYTEDLALAVRGPGLPGSPEVTAEMAEARNVGAALASAGWLPGELLICASSDSGPLRRVFLGDTSLKIVRSATRPVMILPRTPKFEPSGRSRNVKP
ncbi:universal stress protein [Spongiactinospora gelatinilytica]|uniref:Universal stress protein n=1 Tax=Spongiactinospora gelatinilytica TaxID=2666298 RepID=A0A2W2I1F7_9ACTN|nr:universal stress protein [Spongiactinospora gelatinilytica]PZG55828.1 universal stress protein [Spongiactinospora gelatinilytica]